MGAKIVVTTSCPCSQHLRDRSCTPRSKQMSLRESLVRGQAPSRQKQSFGRLRAHGRRRNKPVIWNYSDQLSPQESPLKEAQGRSITGSSST